MDTDGPIPENSAGHSNQSRVLLISLKDKWPTKLLICSVCLAIISIGLLLASYEIIIKYDANWTNPLVWLFYVIPIVILAIEFIVIRKFVTANFPSAALLVIPAYIIQAVNLIYIGLDRVRVISADNPLARYSQPIIIEAAVTALVFFIIIGYFRLVRRLPAAVIIVLGIVILAGFVLGSSALSLSYYDNRALTASKSQESSYDSSLGIKLYLPSYVVPGYKFSIAGFNNPGEKNFEYYDIEYSAGQNTYNVDEFSAPSVYNPPSSCAYQNPLLNYSIACSEIGRSELGCPIYLGIDPATHNPAGFCKLGNVLVTILYSEGVTPPNNNQITDIFNSLQQATKERITAVSSY